MFDFSYYGIMMACWRLKPAERPGFEYLVKDLYNLVDELCPDKTKIAGYYKYHPTDCIQEEAKVSFPEAHTYNEILYMCN